MSLQPSRLNWRYAAGEIAIVVTGILIAISLDSCNDARRDRRLEKEYLTRIAEDLRADTATFSLMGRAVKAKSAALSVADSMLQGRVAIRDTLTLLQALVFGSNFAWSQARVRTTTFDELQSTGNLSLIRDAGLRASIVRYYASAEGDYERIHARRTQYGPLAYALLPRKEEFVLDSTIARARLKQLTNAVLNSEISRAIVAERNFAAFIGSMHTGLRERALQLLAEVDARRPRE